MIFEEKELSTLKGFLTWDKANVSLLGEDANSDVKSIRLEIVAGGMGKVIVEKYVKGKTLQTVSDEYIIGFDQIKDLIIPIYRGKEMVADDICENQLEFDF